MLYDPKWDRLPLASLPKLIAWLETQPPEGRYDFMNCQGACLLGLYMAAHGLAWNGYAYSALHDATVPQGGCWGMIAHHQPWTFGAALDRARAAL